MPEGVEGNPLLRAVLDLCEDAVVEVCVDGRIVRWNRGAEKLYGYTEEEMRGQSLAQIVPIYEVPKFEALLCDLRRGEIRKNEKTERMTKDGSCVCVLARRCALRDESGRVTGMVEFCQARDASECVATGEKQLRMVAEQMPLMVWTTDRQLRITSNWGSGFIVSTIGPGKLVGKTVQEFLCSDGNDSAPITRHFDALRGRGARFEYTRDERVLDIQVETLRSPQGEIVGCLGVALDITDRKRTEEQVLYQATHDALTGLANYREFVETLEHEVKRASRTHGIFSVMLLDMDGLKQINDRHGHLAGNRALKRLANAMREHCRAVDLAARYGGDEFGLVLIDADLPMAEQVAERISNCLREEGEESRLGVSIGVASFPADGRTGAELLETADQRLYHHKKDPKKKLQAAVS